MALPRRGRPIPHPDLSPLMDVILVVLVLVLVNTPIVLDELGVRTSTGHRATSGGEKLVVARYANGHISLNRRVMSEDALQYYLTRHLRSMSKKNVFVSAHANTPFEEVIGLVDLAREAGAAKVALSRITLAGPLPPTSVERGAGLPRGVLLGEPSLTALPGAAIDRSIARRTLLALEEQLEACYASHLEAKPALTGSYLVYVAVGPDGQLLEAPEVQADSVGHLELRSCIKTVLPQLSYPPLGPQRTAAIRYPLLFSPG